MTYSADIVFPCLDEAAAIPGVLAAVPTGYRAIVVDNGSTDGSAAVAAACGALVVFESRRGYGSAVHAGLLAATADVVVVMDCDGSLDPGAIPALVADLAAGISDLAVARRRPTSGASWPWHARAGNRVLAGYLRIRCGLAVHDLAPVRAGRRAELLALGVRDRRSGYPVETLVRAADAGWRITEHDLAYAPRTAGTRSKISGSVRGTAIAVYDMTRVMASTRRTPVGPAAVTGQHR